MVDACPIGWDYKHIVAVARTAPVCLGGPREGGITIYTQLHIHPAPAHRVRYLHSLVLPCEAGTNFTYTQIQLLVRQKSWLHVKKLKVTYPKLSNYLPHLACASPFCPVCVWGASSPAKFWLVPAIHKESPGLYHPEIDWSVVDRLVLLSLLWRPNNFQN